MIPMEEAQEAALKAADIEAADADISATTLSEVAGVACYKVEFTSGEYAYSYTINAQTGAVMEMSSQEQNAQTSGTQTETADPAQGVCRFPILFHVGNFNSALPVSPQRCFSVPFCDGTSGGLPAP